MKFARLIGFCLAGWLVAPATVHAQSTGQISGTVKDSSGAVLPGVTVTITNVNTNIGKSAVTNEHGAYVVTGLPVGTYKVVAELQGFRGRTRATRRSCSGAVTRSRTTTACSCT
jgi:hypothetical protein